eukprot:TRINITY_DN2891_c0_g1_i2.p1 TRINITY_DN2891_c0_g1~~TRINITY_DN2891_c0_g1_i2.p1  ORF type:complete len:447 (-),score=120.35 TRINITY_DN2891_c0_g1_i2:57-1373(-)
MHFNRNIVIFIAFLTLISCFDMTYVINNMDPATAHQTTKMTGFLSGRTHPQYTGYIEIEKETNTYAFFWLMQSEKFSNPQDTATVNFMSGGPGCSSQNANFMELGPWILNFDGSGNYRNNPYSWDKKYNLLFIDQPRGTGFSVSDNHAYNEDQIAKDYVKVLEILFEKFPEFNTQNNGFYLTGESFGGHYVPSISNALLNVPGIFLKGIAVGDGMFDAKYQGAAYMGFGKAQSCFDFNDEQKMQSLYNSMLRSLDKQDFSSATDLFFEMQSLVADNCGFENVYNILLGKAYPDSTSKLLNEKNTKKTLHVPAEVRYEMCNGGVYNDLHNDMSTSVMPAIENVIKAGKKVLIYNGNLDEIIPAYSSELMIRKLNVPLISKYLTAKTKSWKSADNQYHWGWYRQVDNFTHLIVNGAGHMVPLDQPEAASVMLDNLIDGTF